MSTKPTNVPGKELTATEKLKLFVAENTEELNESANEFTDGDYGPGVKDSPSIDVNASSTDTTVNKEKATDAPEEKTKISETKSTVVEKVTIDPQKTAYTADGRVLQLPLPNSLRQFASYNYIIGMYALTNEEINNPDATYKIKKPEIAIMQSGGGLGNSKVLTAYESSGKKIEFFCNSLEIESIISPSRKKGTTNAVGFRLEILEPYSMGLFLQTLQMAAYQAGHQNYTESPFLLTLDFVGYDQDGNPVNVPQASKKLPFKLVGSELEVTNGGSSYVVEGVAYNEGALKDATQSIPVDVTLTGRTLEDLLQSSPKSLANELNKYFAKKAIDGTISTADQYFIVFPKARATKGNLSGVTSDGGNSATTAQNNASPSVSVSSQQSTRNTVSSAKIQEIYKKLKDGEIPKEEFETYIENLTTMVSTTSLGQEITDKQTGKENANVIGVSEMFNLEELGSTQQPFGDASFTWNKELNVWARDGGQMQIAPGLGEIKFAQGTRIQDIIEELIIISSYGRNIISAPSDGTGFKDWFKIDTQVFNITDPTTEKKTGQPPRIYVFRILPYKVHEAKFLSPDKIPYGIGALKKQVCKEYNYIYSGKNEDIITFNINLDNTFFKSMSPGVLPRLNIEEGGKEGENPEQHIEQTPADNDQAISGKSAPVLENKSIAAGAVNVDDMRVEIARRFNDAIVNSDADLLSVEMEIWGDPYYLSDSGIGNYNSENTELINIDADGNVDYQYGEVDILINFRTPVDYKENGMMGFPDETVSVDAFSGLYLVTTVKNMISDGQFKQTLECIRRSNQYPKKPTSQDTESKTNQEIKPKLTGNAIKNIQKAQLAEEVGEDGENADLIIASQNNQQILNAEAAAQGQGALNSTT